MTVFKFFLLINFIFLFSGCALFTKAPQLLTLKRLGDSQKLMEGDIEKKKKNLAKLINDIRADKLKKGIAYNRFIRLYGEPVLEKSISKDSKEKRLLYRHPIKYFDTDKVYLYFNQEAKLIAWEYVKAEPKK
ncbi:MAG: hypothetical protein K9L69_02795 [Candidatus Omnitrophica bacterium]|nr:hypothetical protein [Candidatus Omnitrophota bacterium]MCF7895047.1 hypothetical protein [Candidatus Omnitrophota bacterium]